jgi:hypothetical protein
MPGTILLKQQIAAYGIASIYSRRQCARIGLRLRPTKKEAPRWFSPFRPSSRIGEIETVRSTPFA